MRRRYNFSAGPATLPESVLQQVQQDMLNWQGLGASLAEISHRSTEFIALAERIEADTRRLLAIPDDYAVLFLSGGATTQQALLALNFAQPGQTADYVITGHWGNVALKQAQPYVRARIIADDRANGYRQIPPEADWTLSPDAAYVHLTANETIHGVQFRHTPQVGKVPLIADFSSSLASEPIHVSSYGMIYASAQKNLGPSGICVVIIRRDLLERAGQPRADIFSYASHAARQSMLNTPPTWNWYVLGLTLQWMLDEGGVNVFAQRNQAKAQLLYQIIDRSGGFYRNPVAPSVRSSLNVPFFLPSAADDLRFIKRARDDAGLLALKGHSAVGGVRASIYNAMPLRGVEALVAFMQDYQQRYG